MPKHITLIAAILYTIALTIASLISLEGMPGLGTEWDDKLYHIVAYAGLMLIWYFALEPASEKINLLWIAFGCVVFGIVIEAIQGKVNVNRIGDILDVAANIIGVLIGYLISYRQRLRLS